MIKQWNIEIAAITPASTEDLLKHAIRRELLFGDEGRNFQDVVIFLTLIDDMIHGSMRSAVVVTDDRNFNNRKGELCSYASDRGISLAVWTLKDVEEKLSETLDASTKTRFAEHRNLALSAAMAALPEFQRWINANLSTSTQPLYNFDLRVADVDVPLFEEEPKRGQEIKCSVVLKGSVAVRNRFTEFRATPSFVQSGTSFFERQPIEVTAFMYAKFNGDSYVDAQLGNFVLSWQDN